MGRSGIDSAPGPRERSRAELRAAGRPGGPRTAGRTWAAAVVAGRWWAEGGDGGGMMGRWVVGWRWVVGGDGDGDGDGGVIMSTI